MKNIWMLIALFVCAGCQPDVQDGPAVQPATAAKVEMQKEKNPAPPDTQSAPAKTVSVPQNAKPAQPEPAPAKVVAKTESSVALPVAPSPMLEPVQAEKSVTAEPPAVTPEAPKHLSEAEAMALAKKKNCLACHALDKKVVGPAWRVVAEKYRNDVGAQTSLETKVRKGGKGVWGSVAMPPQPALTAEELTGLVQFVLQLK